MWQLARSEEGGPDTELMKEVQAHSSLDRFVKEVLFLLLRRSITDEGYLTKEEYKAIKARYMDSNDNSGGTPEGRKRLVQVIK